MDIAFSDQDMATIRALRDRYDEPGAVLLPALHLAQKRFGHLNREAMDLVAAATGIDRMKVYGVATFYTMYNKRPVGRHHIQVCTNISCSLLGSDHLLAHLERKLGIRAGGTTPDGRFTLSEVECLGACGTAPVMQVDDEYHENLTEEAVEAVLRNLD